MMRAYTLAFTRLGHPQETTRQGLIAKFDPLFPSPVRELNAELCQMLVYLEAPSAATKLMAALRAAPTQEEQLEYARALRVLKSPEPVTGYREVRYPKMDAARQQVEAELGAPAPKVQADPKRHILDTFRMPAKV